MSSGTGGLFLWVQIQATNMNARTLDATQVDEDTVAIRAINQKIKSDSRVDIVVIPLADGLTLARKL